MVWIGVTAIGISGMGYIQKVKQKEHADRLVIRERVEEDP